MISLRSAGVLGAGLAAAFALSAPAPVAAKDTVSLGIVAFLSGPAAGPYGVPGRNGAEMVIEAINNGTLPAPYNTKGFAGATVAAEYIDESGGNTKQVSEYRNLVQKREVDAVVGYVSSGSCAAIAPVAEELQKLTVMAVCGTPRIFEEAPREYVFRTMSHATADNIAAAHYVKEMMPEVKSYTGINQNYAWGQDSWRDFTLAMSDLMPDVKVSDKPQFPKIFAGQYGSEISALSLDDAELVHSSFWGGDFEAFILQATPRGFFQQKKVVLTVGGVSAYRLGKRLPDGVAIGSRGPYGILVRDRDTPLNKWFVETYHKAYGEYPSGAAYQYAQAILATKIAYDKAGEAAGSFPDEKQVRDALKGLEFESFAAPVKMALGNGHQAITEHMYGIVQWNESAGQLELRDVKVYPAECVMPPADKTSVEWIEAGMPGAKC